MLRRNKPTDSKGRCTQCRCSAGGKCRTGLSEHAVRPPEETKAERTGGRCRIDGDARSCYLLGLAHEKRGDYVSAIHEYDRAIRLDPALAWAFYHRGISHGNIGNDREQAEDLRAAARLGLWIAPNRFATPGPESQQDRAGRDTMNAGGINTKGIRRMVCVCAWCRKVRTHKGSWKTPAVPVRETLKTTITHGICPQCAIKMLTAQVTGKTNVVQRDDTGPSKIRQN